MTFNEGQLSLTASEITVLLYESLSSNWKCPRTLWRPVPGFCRRYPGGSPLDGQKAGLLGYGRLIFNMAPPWGIGGMPQVPSVALFGLHELSTAIGEYKALFVEKSE